MDKLWKNIANFGQSIRSSNGAFDNHMDGLHAKRTNHHDVESANNVRGPHNDSDEDEQIDVEEDGFSPDIQPRADEVEVPLERDDPEFRVQQAFAEIRSPIVSLVFLREYQRSNGTLFPYDYESEAENRPTRLALPLETGEILEEDYRRLSIILLHLIRPRDILLNLFFEPVIPGAPVARMIEDFHIRFEIDFSTIPSGKNDKILEINLSKHLLSWDNPQYLSMLSKIWMIDCFLFGFEDTGFPTMEFQLVDMPQSKWAICYRNRRNRLAEYEDTFSTHLNDEYSITRHNVWGLYIVPFAQDIIKNVRISLFETMEYYVFEINLATLILFHSIVNSPNIPSYAKKEISHQLYVNDRVFSVSANTYNYINACLLQNTKEQHLNTLKLRIRRADLDHIHTLPKKTVQLELFCPSVIVQTCR